MKTTIQILFAVMLYTSSIAQINFEDNIIDIPALTLGVSSVASADIDGDGDIDTVSASSDDNKIAWYENMDGQGTFGSQQIISINAIGAISVDVADIDNDGDMDVVSASRTDNKIAWYENLDGQGNFGAENIITSNAINVRMVRLTDLDGDGDIDVAGGGGSASVGFINWYENIDGQGAFATRIINSNAISLYSIYFADIDGDGDTDIINASSTGQNPPVENEIGWYENTDGQGTFGIHHIVSPLWLTKYAIAIDVDNDNDIDIIASSEDSNNARIVWYENLNGLGAFSGARLVLDNVGGNIISAADINGNGNVDICFVNPTGIYWLENMDGQGNFGTQELITNLDNYAVPFTKWVDIDNDDDLDFITALRGSEMVWYENLNNVGNFGPKQTISLLPNIPSSIFASDLDSDGDIDVLSTSSTQYKAYWYKNLNGVGDFGSELNITNQADGIRQVYASDVDNDGDLDVITGSSDNGDREIIWHENLDGQGNFGPERIISNQGSIDVNFAVSDIDNDGDMDIAFTALFSRIYWYENTDGQGTFINHIISTEFSGPEQVELSDIDNDGDIDVIAAASKWQSPGESKIAWFENLDGQGNFGTEQIIELETYWAFYSSMQVIDFDGDGDNDVFANLRELDEIVWYENIDGQGTFTPKQIIQDNYLTYSAYVTDLDGDNDFDILSASADNNGDNRRLVYYEHIDGQGNFGEPNTIMNFGDHFPTFYSKDIDLDGDVDIAYGIYNRIGWIENLTILKIPEYQNDELALYPNPTNGILTVKSKASIQELAIYNSLGQLILSKTNQKNMIDISTLSNGIYFLKIFFENRSVETKKVLKK